jgi:hypothetical protein
MFDIYWSLFDSLKWDFVGNVRHLIKEHQSIAADWSHNGLRQAQPSTRGYCKMTWVEIVLG